MFSVDAQYEPSDLCGRSIVRELIPTCFALISVQVNLNFCPASCVREGLFMFLPARTRAEKSDLGE